MTPATWFVKLILAHLLTDFILQPRKWVDARNQKHFASPYLYLHGGVTAAMAWLLAGADYWLTALVILFSHIIIDGWKSYRPAQVRYFLLDQAFHVLVIAGCWIMIFYRGNNFEPPLQLIRDFRIPWKIITAAVFLTAPAGIFIGQLTRQWRDKISDAESLANAGKWIGIAERLIIFVFVLLNQFSAIGLLVAAKGIIRFNEKERQEIKTEYLVVGTLLSICLAVMTGLLLRY